MIVFNNKSNINIPIRDIIKHQNPGHMTKKSPQGSFKSNIPVLFHIIRID